MRTRPYRTLDDATVLSAANADPVGFLRGLGDRAVIDEAQRVPGLGLAIKAAVDQKRSPLSQAEILGAKGNFVDTLFSPESSFQPRWETIDKRDLVKKVLTGGFPEAVRRENEQRRRVWFNSYVSTVIQRDVRDIAQIAELADLPRILVTLAQRTGALLNGSELSRTTGIPYTTLIRYLDILRAIFMYQPLPAWSANLGKRLVKAPKIHLVDSGIAAVLAGLDESTALSQPNRLGPIFT